VFLATFSTNSREAVMTRLEELYRDLEAESDPEFVRADKWYAVDFTPVAEGNVDYKQVAEYAHDLRAEVSAAFETLDKKAEWLFGLGLLSVGAMSWMAKEWSVSWGWFILPLICAFASLLFSMRSRLPRNSFLPLSAKAALERAEADSEHFHAWLAASTHVAVTGLLFVCARKAVLLKWSAGFLIAGAFFLSIATLSPHSALTAKEASAPSSTNPNKTP
jgi:hypothetical protein